MSDLDSAQANITEKDDEVYVWMGVTLIIKNEPKKVIKFIIEKQSIQIFETIFELEEFNNLLYLFKRCLLACLCLKETEEILIIDIAQNETFTEIVAAKKQILIAKRIVEKYLRTNAFDQIPKISTLMEIVNYYNDIILIIKQLQSLYVEPDDKSAIILSNLPNI